MILGFARLKLADLGDLSFESFYSEIHDNVTLHKIPSSRKQNNHGMYQSENRVYTMHSEALEYRF